MNRFLAALLLFALIPSPCFAVHFRPNTLREMDANIVLRLTGSVQGKISSGDRMELRVLTFGDFEGQDVLSISERLLIGGEVIEARHESRAGNSYAIFEVNDLQRYLDDSSFEIIIDARVKTSSRMLLGEDYNLAKPIADYNYLLAPTQNIEADDRELRSKAMLEFQSQSELETIREITEWVNSSIEYDFENYYRGIWSAKETYNTRRGVCDEFANLTAAFMRIRGIPARYISGISFDGERFGNHGWLEVFLPGTGWIGVDSTYGEAGYLDAGHIVLAKSADAGDAITITAVATSRSASPPTVETTLHDPVVEVNSAGFFEGLLLADLNSPESLGLNQSFEITAVIENRHNSNIIIPLELVLHEHFTLENGKQLVWLRPLERREISWRAFSPKSLPQDSYARYELLFFSPDGNIHDVVEVRDRPTQLPPGPALSIADVSPYIEGNTLRLELTVLNSSAEDSNVVLELIYSGHTIHRNSAEVPAFTEMKIVQELEDIMQGEVLLHVDAGETRDYLITIPAEITREGPKIKEISSLPAPKTNSGSYKASSLQGHIDPLFIFGVGILLLLLFLLLLRIAFSLIQE